MVYRLYVETVKEDGKIAWAFTFYNHQDFLVYKRAGISTLPLEGSVVLEQSATALAYFDTSMRRRYYDEHFSTRIDEDFVTLFTEVPKIAETASICKESGTIAFSGTDKTLWEAMIPFFTQRTMSFEDAKDERFINAAKELASKQL